MTKKFCVLYIFHGKTPQMTRYGAIHKLHCNSALDDPERNVLRILARPDCDWGRGWSNVGPKNVGSYLQIYLAIFSDINYVTFVKIFNSLYHTGSNHKIHATVGQIGPKLGCFGLYIRSKQRSKSDLTFDNLLVFYIVNL